MPWLNEPPDWRLDGDTLTVTTAADTDFWRTTHYGFVHDNGHLWYEDVAGDFTAEVRFAGQYEHLYDQAGLMLRIDERTWIKSGIEFTDGKQHLSAVVTRDFSDWSVLPLDNPPAEIRLRLTRIGTAVFVDYALARRLLRHAAPRLPPRVALGHGRSNLLLPAARRVPGPLRRLHHRPGDPAHGSLSRRFEQSAPSPATCP